MDIFESLKAEFNHRISFREKRPGVMQVLAPLFHEDGDMVEIYLNVPKTPGEEIQISDHGMTLMRLSYSYEVDTDAKRGILNRILSENGIDEHQGRLSLKTTREGLYPAMLQFAQTLAKVSSMKAFKREVLQSLFYEMLEEFVQNKLSRFTPLKGYLPIPERDDLEVDWKLSLPREVFLFGVKDNAKARLAALSCLAFQQASSGIQFRSVVVHEDFENALSRKDRSRITNVVDKQFTSLSDFQANAEAYFDREMAILRE